MDNYLCSQSSEIISLTQSKYDIRLLWERSRYNKNSIIYIIFTHVLVKIKGGRTCVCPMLLVRTSSPCSYCWKLNFHNTSAMIYKCCYLFCATLLVPNYSGKASCSDFLEIVVVSPGTHLVKKRKSHSWTIDSQFKKWVVNWESLDLYVTRKSLDLKVVHCSKLKYSPST